MEGFWQSCFLCYIGDKLPGQAVICCTDGPGIGLPEAFRKAEAGNP